MKKIFLVLLLLHVSVFCLPADSVVKKIVSQHHNVIYNPPKKIPAWESVDAPLLGNGFTGVAIAGGPEIQTFYIARNDFWRLKSSYNETFPAVLGKLILEAPELNGATYKVDQDLYNAVTLSTFVKDKLTVNYETFVAAEDDMMIIKLYSSAPVKINVALQLPGSIEKLNDPPRHKLFTSDDVTGSENGITWITRGFLNDVDIPTKAGIGMKIIGSESSSISLEKNKPVYIVCSFSSNFKTNSVEDAIKNALKPVDPKYIGTIRVRHENWWHNFWELSYVSIPDKVIEKQYYLSLYGMASSSRDKTFPPGIFGIWVTREIPNWMADYHMNYNYQAPFYGLYSSNRLEQAYPYHAPLIAFIDRGKYYSYKIAGEPEGIMVTIGLGPMGIETTRKNDILTFHTPYVELGSTWDDGLFHGQKSNGVYAVANMAMHFYSTYDEEYAKEIYPFVKGIAKFWETELVYENGRYMIYRDAVHENRTFKDVNPIQTLGLVKMTMKLANDMSEFLNVDSDKRSLWQKIEREMSPFPTFERNGRKVFRYTEQGFEWSAGNTIGIQHIYPAGGISKDSDPELIQLAHNMIIEKNRWLDGNGSNSFFPAAVRVGYSPDTIYNKLRTYSGRIYPNGFQANNPHGIENYSTVPNTVNEMMCSGFGGVVRVFDSWPKDKDAFFHNIRTYGAFLVSSGIKGGKINEIQLLSEKGRPCVLENPWGNGSVQITGSKSGTKIYDGKRISFPTQESEFFTIKPKK